MPASDSGGSMARLTWFSTNLKSRHALRGRQRRNVVARGNCAVVVDQLLHQEGQELATNSFP